MLTAQRPDPTDGNRGRKISCGTIVPPATSGTQARRDRSPRVLKGRIETTRAKLAPATPPQRTLAHVRFACLLP